MVARDAADDKGIETMTAYTNFSATHTITLDAGASIPVQLVDGAAYTREEWDADASADWERSDAGVWTFQGESAPPGVASVTVEAARYILIDRTDDEGGPLDPECYPVNTVAELAEAADALRDAGAVEAHAWVGEGEDAIETSLVPSKATHYAISNTAPPVSVRLASADDFADGAMLATAYDDGETHAEDDLGICAGEIDGAELAWAIGAELVRTTDDGQWSLYTAAANAD